MEIIVTIREVYGKATVYPVCENAKLLAKLTGNKTLTREAIDTIKALGYTISVAPAQFN